MTISLIAGQRAVWKAISEQAKTSQRADVAVAFFGKGAARQLPLPAKSRLVVDASEATVRAGATCPAELLLLVTRGVTVHSCNDLHAKVYVFGRTAFIGSANVSKASGSRLVEAVVRTTDSQTVRAAQRFVTELAMGPPLGPEALKTLQTCYKPPRTRGPVKGKAARRSVVWFEWYETSDYPTRSGSFIERVLTEAKPKRRRSKAYALEPTWRKGPPRYHEGDTLVMVSGDGENAMVSPPGRVVHIQTWAKGRSRYTFSVLEIPQGHRVSVRRLAKALGYGWRKRLSRYGKMNQRDGADLVAWWNSKL
jgi:hypothetical protein